MGNLEQDPVIFGEHEAGTLGQLRSLAERAVRVALMADGHPGIGVPVGSVAAYRNEVSVTGASLDIGCGVRAVKTSRKLGEFNVKKLEKLADKITRQIGFEGARVKENVDTEIDFFEADEWAAVPMVKAREWLKQGAREQLGTVGGGNHYIDILVGADDHLWIATHFGSRGLGYHVARGVMNLQQNRHWEGQPKNEETILALDTPLGQTYWELMQLAHKYAVVGREVVVANILNMLESEVVEMWDTTHNLAFKEKHQGEDLIVVRKGATPVWPGQTGFVGGSMGERAAIIRGRTDAAGEVIKKQEGSLWSTVHGSGRVMSRGKAAGRRTRSGKVLEQGQVTESMMDGWMKEEGIILRGGGVDESPHVYRRLPEVLQAHAETTEIVEWLRPLIVCMAGRIDPQNK